MKMWPLLAVAACAHPGEGARSQARPGATSAGARRSELVLKCQPPDAEVSINAVPQGTCEDYNGEPRGLKLGKSSQVTVKKAGFLPWEGWLAADGTRVVVDIKLRANGGGTP